jgi:transglutaminase-like putative cysteine protease
MRGQWALPPGDPEVFVIRLTLIFATVGLALSACHPPRRAIFVAPSSKHEASWRQTIDYTISRNKAGAYLLHSHHAVSVQYFTPQAARRARHAVIERTFSPVKNISVQLNRTRLPRSVFESFTPELRDVFLTDLRVHRMRLGALQPGDTVSYQYDRSYRDLAYLPAIHVPRVDRLDSLVVRFTHPADVRVEFAMDTAGLSVAPKVSSTSISPQTKRTELRLGPVPVTQSRAFYAYGAPILIHPRVSRGSQALTPHTEKRFLSWYMPQLPTPSDAGALSAKQKSWARSLVAGKKSAAQKIAALYDAVKTHVHYIADARGRGSIVPRNAGQVLERRYGDCKDKSLLLIRLAASVGIEGYLTLVTTHARPRLSGLRIGMFNHAIAAFLLDGKWVFLDPTARFAEYGNLPSAVIHHTAFILKQPPEFHEIRPAKRRAKTLEVSIDGRLEDPVAGRGRIVLRNELRWAAAAMKKRLSGFRYRDALAELVASQLPRLSVSKVNLAAENEAQLELSANIDFSAMVTRSAKLTYVPAVPLPVISGRLFERNKDKLPLHFSGLHDVQLSLSLRSKEALKMVRDASFELSDEAVGRHSASAQVIGNSIRLTYRSRRIHKVFGGNSRKRSLSLYRKQLDRVADHFALSSAARTEKTAPINPPDGDAAKGGAQ